MGARGPAPTPTKVLEARGSWRAKTREDEPTFPGGLPPCPAWMPVAGKDEWDRVVEQLGQVPGMIQQVDWSVLCLYCEAWADYVGLLKASKGKSRIKLISSGLANQKRKLVQDISRLAQQFGFTPASRSRVQVRGNGSNEGGGEKEKSLEAKFFSKPKIHESA